MTLTDGGPVLTLHAVQARFGDCLLLEVGGPGRRFILIDGGPPDTFESDLEPALKEIVGVGNALDLVVLSHVDNDHVVGLLDLLASIQQAVTNKEPPVVRVKRLWCNTFANTLDPDGDITQRLQMLMNIGGTAGVAMPLTADATFGIREGYRLRTLASQLDLDLNADFGKGVITVESAAAAVEIGPLSLQVVGPTRANLERLRYEWLTWLDRNEQKIMRNPETAANSDRSVPNLSSIVLLAKYGEKTILLTGDARGDHIEQGLKQAGLTTDNKLHVNVLKLQHHGSDRNAAAGFFERITADTYVASADGTYGNPDFDTLKWIIQAAKKQGRTINIVVTNETPATRKLVKNFKPSRNNYALTVRPDAAHSVPVTLS